MLVKYNQISKSYFHSLSYGLVTSSDHRLGFSPQTYRLKINSQITEKEDLVDHYIFITLITKFIWFQSETQIVSN